MFYLCDNKFIVFDDTDFNPEDFNLPNPKQVTLEEIQTEYQFIPILELNEFLLRILNSKFRTDTHKLGENNINSYYELVKEYDLIQQKKSTKSSAIRNIVVSRLNHINNLK